MTKRRLYYFLFFTSLMITLAGSEIYRPYIWSNGMHDYGLADSCTNISGVLTACFLFIANMNYSDNKKDSEIIIGSILGFITYEFMQIFLPWGTFDWGDIIGTVIGGVLTMIIVKITAFHSERGLNQ